MAIWPWQGLKKTGWMLRKRSGLWHPYVYKNKENAEKQLGWFGDEVVEVRILEKKKHGTSRNINHSRN